jgi:hypothetical protein
MTTLGCRLNQSAINKIERGDPPRRITVDELIAFAQVFELEVEDLLIPAHAARERQIETAYRALVETAQQIDVFAGVYRRQLETISQLALIDDAAADEIALAGDGCRAAMTELASAIESVSEGVRQRLRRSPPVMFPEPKPKASQFNVRRPDTYEKRAARAASPVKRGADVKPSEPQRPSKATR